jgi:hypothetical protein
MSIRKCCIELQYKRPEYNFGISLRKKPIKATLVSPCKVGHDVKKKETKKEMEECDTLHISMSNPDVRI